MDKNHDKVFVLTTKVELLVVYFLFSLFLIFTGCSENKDEKTTALKSEQKQAFEEKKVVEKVLQTTDVKEEETQKALSDFNKSTEQNVTKTQAEVVIKKEPTVKIPVIAVAIKKEQPKEKSSKQPEMKEEKKLQETKTLENNTTKKAEIVQVVPPKRYQRDADTKIVRDSDTGYFWQDDTSVHKQWVTDENFKLAKYDDSSGDTAHTYCQTLALGGFDDWRLPTVEELRSLKHTGDANLSKALQEGEFENLKPKSYWSSTPYPGFQKAAWYVNYLNGYEFGYAKNINLLVKCVRKDGEKEN